MELSFQVGQPIVKGGYIAGGFAERFTGADNGGQKLQQLVQGDGEIAKALTCRVVDRVSNSSCSSRNADFTDAVRAKRSVGVRDIEEVSFDFGNVRIHRDVILGEARIYDTPVAFVEEGFFG